ncbi:uncharacterized protein LOC135703945 [Ochlerotatus camptorhynchus]|uniref:uncharacterized protein LOC135703945 n=1 Tax=Ochlerotatus camptorhynchus TaxID=644619 RepID=UPI0031D82479
MGVVAERQPAVQVCQPSRTKYPELRLPTFSGKLLEWINFRDNFKSLIHDNHQLCTIDKFNYLRTSLKDDALLQINQIQVTAANYTLAWGILESKFENHKLIAQEHLKALFAVAPMKLESFQGLNHVLTTFRINLQQLEKLGENTENWSTLLAFMLSQKLDDDTLRQWETHHSSKNIPSYKAMEEFLENYCGILQSTSARRSNECRKSYKNPVVHAVVSSKDDCPICNAGPHSVEQCRRFGNMKVVDRKMLVRKLGLCLNCLRSGHFVADCSRSTCNKCGYSHHYLLHPYTAFAKSCQTTSCLSIEESACEAIFEETTTRDPDGKFRVTLPKRKHMLEKLGESKAIAKKRYLSMEKRLNANPEMKALYSTFMHDYLSMGHMTEVVNDDEESGPEYYLPHHAVLKPDSTTTKLRVVFDASYSTDSVVSLNDVLMVGPVVQDDLRSILLRFRLFKYAVVGDAEKMYRMVWQHELDQLLHKIFWRDSVQEPLRTYKLSTVTYGTSSAPYLATRCLNKCAEDGAERYPVASVVVKKSFYVDDMLAGSHTVEEGEQLCKEVLELLKGSGFNLRKWNSNNPTKILKAIPSHLRDDREFLNLDEKATVKTLGLTWKTATDTLWIKVPDWRPGGPITHRVVLSEIARLFDPYGLVGPVVVQGKLFLQELWKAKYSWDEPLSDELQSQWLEFRTNLCELDAVSVPRWIRFGRDVITCEFHGFSDASDKAYGAAIYLRCVNRDGEVTINLLLAKSKVAPLEDLSKRKKKQSTPRLELSAALLLAHLYESVSTSMMIAAKSFFWTDSTIVKFWISSHPSRWQVFVANRVSEIQHVTKGGIWNHVPGIENPADIISRGATPAQITSNSLWWNGLEWLKKETQYWPVNEQVPEQQFDSVILEERPLVSAVLQTLPPSEIFTLRSSLLNLVRLTAWIRRFSFNCRPRNRLHRKTGLLTAGEHDSSLILLVQLAQSECFPLELSNLAAKGEVRPSSKLHALNPVMVDGILCVGGRLGNAPVSRGRKHPMILDSHHPLTKLILVDYHRRLLHGGPQLMISCVRERFWPLSVRNLARKVMHECVKCFRVKPRVHDQLMGDLPLERVSPAPAFQRVGIDYCGPFELQPVTRKSAPVKCYLCLFVCLVCKAVHIEVVMDLTTETFLAALRRFVARRGRPELILCDNASNFVGAQRELRELHRMFRQQQFQEKVSMEAAQDSIEFKFIPARSPNFGGLWEAAVKSLKGHMRRVIGNRMLKYDELHTVVTQIEACLNSRPLTPLSNHSGDLEALTPGHFLIQRPLTSAPEPSLHDLPENRLNRWQRVQNYSQLIWKRWSTDYLSTLQSRNKWTRQRNNLNVGTMVLLKEDNIPPLKWKLGRVMETHPGPDGNVRVVTVRTKDGSYRRAISKIRIFLIRDNQLDVEESQ